MTDEPTFAEDQQLSSEYEEVPASLVEKSLLYLITAAVIVMDLLSKLLIEARLPINSSWMPITAMAPFFQISHVSNTGAAFGLFPSGSTLFMVVAIIVSLAIVVYNLRLPGNNYLYRVALGLQLGGAMGNLISRVRLGHVTDFLDFGPWPVFNLADTSIVAGVALLAYLMLQEHRQEKARQQELAAVLRDKAEKQAEPAEDPKMLWNE